MEEKILIVDDAAFIRLLIKNTLKRAGFSRFFEAEKGKEALELYKKEKPDLVILDITMGGMSGLEVLEALINIDRQARVIMCSSVGKEEIVQKALNLGAWSFLVKPFNPETLSQLVQNAFS